MPRYWFDQEAVREPHLEPWRSTGRVENRGTKDVDAGANNGFGLSGQTPRLYNPAGRNVRSVWEIATQPYPEAHFATFPEELARRCIVAGCPEWVCGVCGKPRERIVEREGIDVPRGNEPHLHRQPGNTPDRDIPTFYKPKITTLGWSDCGCKTDGSSEGAPSATSEGLEVASGPPPARYRPGVVLDPFGGSGTVAAVARKHGRRAVLIELNEAYCELIARRTAQQSLLAEGAVSP